MNRKTKKLLFIILILFISIGFAVLSASTIINSTINFLPQSFNIYFDNLVVNQESSNLDNPTLDDDDTSVEFTTTINEPGDFYEFSFDVVNAGTMDAALQEIIKSGLTSTQEEYLDYTARYYGNREIKVDDILHAGYKEKIVVRVEYKYDIDDVISMGTINFNFGLNYIKRDLQKDYGEETWSIDYTGSEHIFIPQETGSYKLEVWGAQGGIVRSVRGGYGGYSTGNITLTRNSSIYINVGGKGTDGTGLNDDVLAGGYNGGGESRNTTADARSAGGGATHIATVTNRLSQLESQKGDFDNNSGTYLSTKIIIVAGGGGGAGEHKSGNAFNNGGNAGGYKGSAPTNSNGAGAGGTQSAGGTSNYQQVLSPGGFGAGCSWKTDNASGGGGGFYGGGCGYNLAGAGGGGSGYIGNTNLTDKVMYCFSCKTSENETDETHIKTRSTTNVSEEPISNYAKIGNGYVRITYLG